MNVDLQPVVKCYDEKQQDNSCLWFALFQSGLESPIIVGLAICPKSFDPSGHALEDSTFSLPSNTLKSGSKTHLSDMMGLDYA